MSAPLTKSLTSFRENLTDIIERLDETGPVRVTDYRKPVAEIRPLTPVGDRLYAKAILDAFAYLEEVETGLTLRLADTGIDTLDALSELADRHRKLTESGVTFDPYPEHCLPDEGSLSVDEALARLYFGDDYPEGVSEPYAWFLTCTRLQQEAKKRGLSTTLPSPNAYDEEGDTFVELAIHSGHTPDSLREFGIRAMDQGVQLERLADMLGREPVPADVVAMNTYSDWTFEQLTKAGLPHAEAVAVFRQGIDTRDAESFAQAGIRSADEIRQLIESRVRPDLALRAASDGVAPADWKQQVPRIQHLKYKGIDSSLTSDPSGILPFPLLVQAADEGVSLVRWDSNTLQVEQERNRKFFHASTEKRMKMHPWVHIYTDNVLDVARAGLLPSYVTAFAKLMRHHFNDASPSHEFVTTAIRAHELGLTTAMANAMSRSDSKQPKFTPEQLITFLEEEPSVHYAHYLAGRYDKPEEMIDELRQRRERQLMTDTFIATVESTPVWQVVKDSALAILGLFKSRSYVVRNEMYLKGVVEKFLDGGQLNDHELMTLLNWVRLIAFSDKYYYLGKEWHEQQEPHKEAIIQLSRSFDAMRQASSA